MEGETASRRGGVKSRRSRSFSGFLGGYPSISQGPRSRSGEADDEEEGSEENEAAAALQMTQFMGQLTQAVAPRNTSRSPELNTPSMKAPDSFPFTKAYKLRVFIQYCPLTFHND
ncbi:hypothetical protein O181_097155 [Austropuccinia psidii MF-1]|uniref:Uncharacterized protein n=1 Tax=Austropuccinia psidii MF-1 TaxID=1389203 RepID=A0A9Q3J903_9BASI|nr:hypothetical protein [Austropuccinia psidii MF-1]